MAADLFESYAVTLVAALILARRRRPERPDFPLIVSTVAWSSRSPPRRLHHPAAGLGQERPDRDHRAFYISAALSAVIVAVASFIYLPSSFAGFGANAAIDPAVIASHRNPQWGRIGAVVIGIVLAAASQALTATSPRPSGGRAGHRQVVADRRGHRRTRGVRQRRPRSAVYSAR